MTAAGYSHDKTIRSLQRNLYRAAKANPRRAFHQLYEHVHRREVLWASWQRVKNNGGAGGVDDIDIETFEATAGAELARISEELRSGSYRPLPVRRVRIPKSRTETRPLGIPAIRDRIVQDAIRLVLEPVLEARFYEHSYGFRPRRSAHRALELCGRLINSGYRHVLDVDIRQYFDSVPHGKLIAVLRRHVSDGRLLGLVKRILRAPVRESSGELRANRKGCPQGGPLSPLLSNLYLDLVDQWFAKQTRYKDLVWIRYADDGVVVSKHPVEELRNRLELLVARMELTLHPRKTRVVDMGQRGGTFDFLGYRFAVRRAQNGRGNALLQYPSPRALSKIRDKLREVIPVRGSRDVARLVAKANRVLLGWVNYFAHSNRKKPFQLLSTYVCARIRRYLVRQRGGGSRGTRRFSDQWIRERLGLINPYHVFVEKRLPQPYAAGRR